MAQKQRRPKLEYSLLCPLICKYCARSFPWPFTRYWDHIRNHELKYRRFWYGSDHNAAFHAYGIRQRQDRKGPTANVTISENPTSTCSKDIPGTTSQSKNNASTSKASRSHHKKFPPLHPKICKYCRRRFFHRFWRYHRHIKSHERRYNEHWYDIVHGKKARHKPKCVKKGKGNRKSAYNKAIKKIQEAIVDDNCTIGDLLRQKISEANSDSPSEKGSEDLDKKNVSHTKSKRSDETQALTNPSLPHTKHSKKTSADLNKNVNAVANLRTSRKQRDLPEHDPEASSNTTTSKDLNENIIPDPVTKATASDKKYLPEPLDSEASSNNQTSKDIDDKIVPVLKIKSTTSKNKQEQTTQNISKITQKSSSKKIDGNRVNRKLKVKLFKMQIEPKELQVMPSSSQTHSDHSSHGHTKTGRGRRKTRQARILIDSNEKQSDHDVVVIQDREKQPKRKKKEVRGLEEHFLQDLHFLGHRKRPQAGYYSRLTKGLGVNSKDSEDKGESKISKNVTKSISRNQKSSQTKVKLNDGKISKVKLVSNTRKKGEKKGKKSKEKEEQDEEEEKEQEEEEIEKGKEKENEEVTDDEGEEWQNSGSEGEEKSSDESYKAEESESDEDDLSSGESTEHFVTDNEQIVVRVKSENESEDNQSAAELNDSRSSISSAALKNPDGGNREIVGVPAEQLNHNGGNSALKSLDQKDIFFSDEYFKNVARHPEEKESPRYITNMKRLTKEQLDQLQKDKESKKYVHNVPCFKTKRRKFGCKICGKYFPFERYLKTHMTWHTTPNKYTCKFCGKSFKWKFKLRDHINTHTGRTPYRCRICGKGFPNSKNIKAHERFHTGEKPYKCNYCEKRFRLQCMLICHTRYHTGERPFACETCGAAFHTNSHMRRHQAVHTGENRNNPNRKPKPPRPKNIPCEYCGKMFSSNSGVKIHRRTHTKEKPFACVICGKRFGHKSHRGRHERTVHGGQKPHKCSYCGKGFTDISNMKTHEKYVHAWDDASTDEKVSSDEDMTKDPETPARTSRIPSSTRRTKNQGSNKTNPLITARTNPQSIVSKSPSAKIFFSRKDKPKTQPALFEYSADQLRSDNDDALSETEESAYKAVQPKPSSIRINDNTPSRGENRSVFDKFVSKTNVNIVVKHTCGKHKKKIVSSHRSANFGSSNAAEGNSQSRSLFSQLKSSLNAGNFGGMGSQIRNAASEMEEDERHGRVPEHFSSRNTSRCSSESRDFKSTLSRLESIQRNAKLVADALRRKRRGKNIPHKQHQEPVVQNERMSSLESLLHSLESASDSAVSHWSKTDYRIKHKKRSTDIETRDVLPRAHRAQKHNKEISRDSSSLDSFTSDEEPPPDASEINEENPSTHSTNLYPQSSKRKKKGWHLSLTPEMQRRLGRQRREKKYNCSFCNKEFLWESNMRIHESEHTDGKQYSCRFCKKKFTLRSGVKRHERTHTGEKRFKCRFCPKRFSEKYNLTGHERIHTGEKPYKCLTCGMSFIESGSLTKHEKCHSSERPYKCTYKGCNMTFKRLPAFKRHKQALHLGVRYDCVFCSASYSRRETLYAHERVHHSGSKPYLCQHCGRRFADCEKYKQHMMNKHKEKT